VEGFQVGGLELLDPAAGDFMEGDGIEVVEFFAAAKYGGDEVGGCEDGEVLGDGLAAHRKGGGELRKREAVVCAQSVQNLAAVRGGEGFEDFVHGGTDKGNQKVAWQAQGEASESIGSSRNMSQSKRVLGLCWGVRFVS